MRREDVRAQDLALWREWSEALSAAGTMPPDGAAVHQFWEYLTARHPQVVDFRSFSPYDEIRAWLAEDCIP